MAEFLPIMLALCSMLLYAHYAKNYTGIINAGLTMICVNLINVADFYQQ